jgi:hypothetical protein
MGNVVMHCTAVSTNCAEENLLSLLACTVCIWLAQLGELLEHFPHCLALSLGTFPILAFRLYLVSWQV